MEIPFSESLRVLNEGDFTLVAWFWALALPGENREVFQQMDRNGTGRTWLFVHGDTNEIRSYLGGATTSSGVLLEPGVWYHAAVVVTEGGGSDTVQLYVNGEPAGAPTPQAMESSEGNYLIGCHKNFTNFWNGLIDEVALFNRALSPEEIQALMNEGLEGALSVDPAGKLSLFWGGLKRSAW
ncbi:MAG: hypothetical protein KatS3mg115_1456 [Candidatus Poribacteria bacterium]|nr:MAG: hypothetical protein KatS3mg115_1456 [Candidatus Poribacteria bacterium]